MNRLSKRSKSRLQGINKTLLKIAIEGVKDAPYDYGIPLTGGLRTAKDQNQLYNKKVSKCDGYSRKSSHQTGKAFDIYAYVDGKASWKLSHLIAIGKHLRTFAWEKYGIKLKWGGEFLTRKQRKLSKEKQAKLKEQGKGWDKPHFQIS